MYIAMLNSLRVVMTEWLLLLFHLYQLNNWKTFFKDLFLVLYLYLDRKVSEVGEREGDGIGKGLRAGIRTQDAWSTTALHGGALPTRISAPTWKTWKPIELLVLRIK